MTKTNKNRYKRAKGRLVRGRGPTLYTEEEIERLEQADHLNIEDVARRFLNLPRDPNVLHENHLLVGLWQESAYTYAIVPCNYKAEVAPSINLSEVPAFTLESRLSPTGQEAKAGEAWRRVLPLPYFPASSVSSVSPSPLNSPLVSRQARRPTSSGPTTLSLRASST